MKKEFYVAQVLSWNPQLRAALLSAAGIHYQSEDPDYVLADFEGEENLARLAGQLACSPGEVFERLHERVAETFAGGRTARYTTLNADDIKLFFDEAFLKGTSEILSSSDTSEGVVKALFDETAMRDLMVAAKIAHPDEDTSFAKLFWRLLSPKGAVMLAHHLGGPSDLWPVLNALLKESAAAILCDRLSCKAEDIFSCLKTRFADSRTESETTVLDESQKLDTLGVAKLSELLRALSSTHLQRAKKVAQKVADRGLLQGGSPILLALLEFYGNRAYRAGLLSMTTPMQPIRTFSEAESIQRKAVQEFSSTLELRAAMPTITNGKAAVFIEFKSHPGSAWEHIATIMCADSKTAKHIAKWLPTHSRSLKGAVGDDLLETVLNHQIPSLGRPEQAAWDVWLREDNSLVAYFVLSGMRIPDQLQLARTFGSVSVADHSSLSDKERTVCQSPLNILAAVMAHYKANGQAVTVR